MAESSGTNEVKTRYIRNRPGMSVYVASEITSLLGGRRSIPLGQAIRCWARVMVPAALWNERPDSFSPGDWKLLALVMEGREFGIDPELGRPQDVVAEAVDRALHLGQERTWGVSSDDLRRLADRVRGLNYIQTWALLWSLQWRAHNFIEIGSAEPWWTIAHRQKTAPPLS